MATTKRLKDDASFEDTEDILEEVGAERDEDGQLVVDEETIRKTGVADAESVLTNRRRRAIATRKRRGEKKVPFDTDDVLDKYDNLLQSGLPASAFYIKVRRLTGPELSEYVRNYPASGLELFEALKAIHGQNPSYQYHVEIKKAGTHTIATSGRVAVPDTRPMHMREPQMNPYQPPFQQAPVAQAVPAAPPNPANPVEQFGQMFEMFQRFQQSQQTPQVAVSQAPAASSQQPDMMQMFELFMKMQGKQMPAQQPPPPAVHAPPAQPDTFQQMSQMLELFAKLQAMQQRPEPRPSPRVPRYDPETGEPVRRFGPSNGHQPPPQPQRPATPAESLRQALAEIRSFKNMMREIDDTLPEADRQEVDEPEPENDRFYTEEIGKVKVVRKKDDDEILPWATGLANFPDAFKWVNDTYEKFKKETDAKRQQEARQRRVLPPGYVEILPGQPIQAPPGYVVVPVSEEEIQAVQQPEPTQELPPVPADIPPPIQEDEAPEWSQPIIPSRGRD